MKPFGLLEHPLQLRVRCINKKQIMALFKIEKRLEYIKEKPFKLEKEIQDLTEKNLKAILGLDFVKSEFALNNFRIDTLAFDKEANAFVIP